MPDSILVSYGWQTGRKQMEAINQKLGELNPIAPHRWQFNDLSREGEAYGGFKHGPELWGGAFRRFPWDQFVEWLLAADWEERDAVQVLVTGEDADIWRVHSLAELAAGPEAEGA